MSRQADLQLPVLELALPALSSRAVPFSTAVIQLWDVNPRRALNWRRHEPSGDFVNREVIADPPEGLVLANGRDTRARE